MAAIEEEELAARIVMEDARNTALQVVTDPGRSEPLALKAQVGNLVEWIDHPQLSVEFQAVDDPYPIGEPDVLGAQIAMPVDEAPKTRPPGEGFRPQSKEAPLHALDASDEPRGQTEALVQKNGAVA